jgi:hypothetical protein
MSFRLQNEFFDGIKKNIHSLPFDSPLRKLFVEDRRTFWYVVKRWAWFAHNEAASEITSANPLDIEDYLLVFMAWERSDRSVPFAVFHHKLEGQR